MATNNVTGITKALQLLPSHEPLLVSDPTDSDEESSAKSARTQNRQGILEIRGISVIECELGGRALILLFACLLDRPHAFQTVLFRPCMNTDGEGGGVRDTADERTAPAGTPWPRNFVHRPILNPYT